MGTRSQVFCIGFTKRRVDQTKRTCYAQSAQIRKIRAKMVEIIKRECESCDLKELVLKFIPKLSVKRLKSRARVSTRCKTSI